MKSVDLLQLICEQYIRAWGWWGGHAQNKKNIPIALLKCDRYMKNKTSITLSKELLLAIDQLPEQYKNRSFFLEEAAWAFIAQMQRAGRERRDIEILNQQADYLNGEVADALVYQVPL